MKERQIKIYGFDRDSVSDGVISSDHLQDKLVNIARQFLCAGI